MKHVLRVIILILIAIFIFQLQIRKLSETQNEQLVSFRLPIYQIPSNCYYRFQLYYLKLPFCQQYQIGTEVVVIGRVDGVSDSRFFQQKRLTVEDVKPAGRSLSSVKAWFLGAAGWVAAVKADLLEYIFDFIPQPAAGLITGMLFGGSGLLAADLNQDFQVIGLSHVVAASGYNLSLIVGLVQRLGWKKLNRWLNLLISLVTVMGFTLLAELNPAVVRAAVMMMVNLIGTQVFYRQYSPIYSLVLTLLICPLGWLFWWWNISFQLSILATAGIALFLPIVESPQGSLTRFQVADLSQLSTSNITTDNSSSLKKIVTDVVTESWQVTLAAQSLTLPLILWQFGELSLLSLVANVALLWLTPVITILGLVYVAGSGLMSGLIYFWPASAWLATITQALAAQILWLPTQLFLRSAEWLGQFEFTLVKLKFPLWLAVSWWVIMGGWLVIKYRSRQAPHAFSANISRESSAFSSNDLSNDQSSSRQHE